MPFESDGTEDIVPHKRFIPHYHGDEVRVMFVVAAIIMILGQSTGAELPLSTFGSVLAAAALVIAAGVTSPRLTRIHWINAAFSFVGTLIFGTTAVTSYRDGVSIFDSSFVYVEALALIALVSLYFTIRTLRGILLRTRLK
jgi:hypothetical protein